MHFLFEYFFATICERLILITVYLLHKRGRDILSEENYYFSFFQQLNCSNENIITWMLQQIFMFSNNVKLAAGYPSTSPFSPFPPPLLLDERTEKEMSSMLPT